MPQLAVKRSAQRGQRAQVSVVKTGNATWDQAVRQFLADGKRRNLSPTTLINYESYLCGQRMRTFLEDAGIKTPADFDAPASKRLQSELLAADVKPGTVDTFQRVLKNFVAFAIREGLGGSADVLDVKGPHLAQREPETYTADEEYRLLAALKDRPRDHVMFELMLRTGVRLEEVTNLTLEDVIETPTGHLLRVRQGKGRKDRYIPLDTSRVKFSDTLRKYIAKVRPATSVDALFVTYRKDGGDYVPLTRNAIQTLCKRLSLETGIHVNPHKFRHTFATRSLAAGVDVMALKKALGHTTLAMVSRYVHYQTDDLVAAWQARRD